jgi:hypothetical protein
VEEQEEAGDYVHCGIAEALYMNFEERNATFDNIQNLMTRQPGVIAAGSCDGET